MDRLTSRRYSWLAGLVSLFLWCSPAAWSQDRCSEILSETAFSTEKFWQRDILEQIVFARFAGASYHVSRNDKALGFGIPTGETVLGGEYSEQDFERRREEINSAFNTSLTRSREIDVALASGDRQIKAAWISCMTGKDAGLSLRFEIMNARQTFAVVEWFPIGTLVETTLAEDVVLPKGIKVLNNAQCLKKGTSIAPGSPCLAVLELPDERTTLLMTIRAKNGSAQAYLPPRIKRIVERRPHWPKGAEYPKEIPPRSQEHLTVEVASDWKNGWRFDPGSAALPYSCIRCVDSGICRDPKIVVAGYRALFDIDMANGNIGRPLGCAIYPVIDMVRDRWVSLDHFPGESVKWVVDPPVKTGK